MNDQVSIDTFSKQVNDLVQENHRLRAKSDADDEIKLMLKKQYDDLSAGVEVMVEEHKEIEKESQERYSKQLREWMFRCDRSERSYSEISGLLTQVGSAAMVVNELIMQAVRAKVGDITPEKMPKADIAKVDDNRLPPMELGK